ncbi:MAG TPA: alpha/beta fold hydrolase [Chitinophagaceae bacterium]|nr:alpha/beta fold hydrolase [Chitinophagaceae bacterium]
MNTNWKKNWKKWIPLLLACYLAGGSALYFLQDALLLHPVPVRRDQPYAFPQPHQEINIPISASSNLNFVRFPSSVGPARGVVLYFHGNRDNVSRYARYAPAFTRQGYEVWMMDYPGFGKSTGKCSEQTLYDWALQFYKFARSRFSRDSILIYGKSLGTGIATQLASVRDCRRLILESPYFSMGSLASHYFFMYPVNWLLHYRLPTGTFLRRVSAPVTIFHGSDDGLIPLDNARKLQACLKPGDRFITIPGGGHNDLFSRPDMTRQLDSLLAR